MYYFHKLLRNVKKKKIKDLVKAPLNPNRDLLIYSQMLSSGHTLKRPVPSRGPPSPPSHSQDSIKPGLHFPWPFRKQTYLLGSPSRWTC